MRADACARSLHSNCPKKFWKDIYKMSNDKATKFATCINGIRGDENIARLWRDHFHSVYNALNENEAKVQFFTKLKQCSNDVEMLLISEEDVWNAIMHQKKGKAMGPDRVAMEAYLLEGSVLCQYLRVFCIHV